MYVWAWSSAAAVASPAGGVVSPSPRRLAAAVGNFLEQAVPFLLVFWLHVVFAGNPQRSALFGWAYMAFRALYPLLFTPGGAGASTAPAAAVVAAGEWAIR